MRTIYGIECSNLSLNFFFQTIIVSCTYKLCYKKNIDVCSFILSRFSIYFLILNFSYFWISTSFNYFFPLFSRFSHIFLRIFHFPLHHLHFRSLSYASVFYRLLHLLPRFPVSPDLSYPRFPRNAIDDGDFNAWYNKNAAPTFALLYVEHANSPRVAKHTGPSEKRKHRRAAEDNCRRSPPSPGTAEIVYGPLDTFLRCSYFRLPRCSVSLPLRCSWYSADFLAIGKTLTRMSFPKISSNISDLRNLDWQKHRCRSATVYF